MNEDTKTIERQKAKIEEQKKLIAHIERSQDKCFNRNLELEKHTAHLERRLDNSIERNRNLVQKNDNQVEIIKQLQRRNNSQYNDLEDATTKLREWRIANNEGNRINAEQALVIEANCDQLEFLEAKLEEVESHRDDILEQNSEQRSQIAGLENRLNDSQYADFRNYQSKIDEQRQSIRDWMKLTDELRAEIAGLEKRLSDSLVSYETAAKERDQLKATNLLHTMENVDAVEMVGKIVAAMTDAGFDIAGWGNDDQLTELEAVSSTITDQATELAAMLDAIRTER